jgi:cytochrome b pre-mRNA-processing protein 3
MLLRAVCINARHLSAVRPHGFKAGFALRYIASTPKLYASPKTPPQSWLTRKVTASPGALKVFLAVAKILGYDSPRQIAGRRAFILYERVCAVRADEDREFWRTDCHLPPTFQSWFIVTNLHIWLMTVRLRALPPPYGDAFIQALIDHFFMDVEDRIRAVLQPSRTPAPPYTFVSPFYSTPGIGVGVGADKDTKTENQGRAPDRLVTRQMKIFKEQWAGMGLAFDLGLIKGDMDMAGAVWRNLLGARGARGIAYDDPSSKRHFRRSINLAGGVVEDPAEVERKGIEAEEARDDYSGVHDFGPGEADQYVSFPEVMLDVVAYVRRELVRLDHLTDDEIIRGDTDKLKFGKVRLSNYSHSGLA